jgi:hypothetical protein
MARPPTGTAALSMSHSRPSSKSDQSTTMMGRSTSPRSFLVAAQPGIAADDAATLSSELYTAGGSEPPGRMDLQFGLRR